MSRYKGMETAQPKRVVKHVQAPTHKQRKLARAVADNLINEKETLTTQAMMLKVGYSPVQAKASTQITQSQGFLKALDELGLTDEFIVSSLVSDIRAKPERRAFELSIAAKIRGMEKRAIPDGPQMQNMAINNAVIVIQLPPKQ